MSSPEFNSNSLEAESLALILSAKKILLNKLQLQPNLILISPNHHPLEEEKNNFDMWLNLRLDYLNSSLFRVFFELTYFDGFLSQFFTQSAWSYQSS